MPGREREKLSDVLKRVAPPAVELSSPDWWLHNQFMVCIMLVVGHRLSSMNQSI